MSALLAEADDPQVVTASRDSTVRVWDLAPGKYANIDKSQNGRQSTLFSERKNPCATGEFELLTGIYAMAYDRSRRRLVTYEADITIKIWKGDWRVTPETQPLKWKVPISAAVFLAQYRFGRKSR